MWERRDSIALNGDRSHGVVTVAIVMAHGVAAHSQFGGDAAARLQKAMEQAILACNAEGITNSEENSVVIGRRMRLAHQTELLAIMREEHEKAVVAAHLEHRTKLADLEREYSTRIADLESVHSRQVADVEASIAELTT